MLPKHGCYHYTIVPIVRFRKKKREHNATQTQSELHLTFLRVFVAAGTQVRSFPPNANPSLMMIGDRNKPYSCRPRKHFIRKPNFYPAIPLRLRLLASLHESKELVELDKLEALSQQSCRMEAIQEVLIHEQFRAKVDVDDSCCYIWSVEDNAINDPPRRVTIIELEHYKGENELPCELVQILYAALSTTKDS